jgi:hypothetical protein
VDALAEKFPNISGYAYCGNNPIMFVDPDGNVIFPSATALRTAGEGVVNNSKYKKASDGTTYCNFGTQAIVAQGGKNMVKGTATAMVDYLKNKDNARTISQEQAQEYANGGVTIYAGYRKQANEKSSHVAIVAPNEGKDDKTFKVFNVGNSNGELTLGQSFGKRTVEFFILNEDYDNFNLTLPQPIELPEVTVYGTKTETQRTITLDVKPLKIENTNLNLNIE